MLSLCIALLSYQQLCVIAYRYGGRHIGHRTHFNAMQGRLNDYQYDDDDAYDQYDAYDDYELLRLLEELEADLIEERALELGDEMADPYDHLNEKQRTKLNGSPNGKCDPDAMSQTGKTWVAKHMVPAMKTDFFFAAKGPIDAKDGYEIQWSQETFGKPKGINKQDADGLRFDIQGDNTDELVKNYVRMGLQVGPYPSPVVAQLHIPKGVLVPAEKVREAWTKLLTKPPSFARAKGKGKQKQDSFVLAQARMQQVGKGSPLRAYKLLPWRAKDEF